MIPAFYH